MPSDRVDLMRALCRALSLDDGSMLAPDIGRVAGGGWISRAGAVRLALELCEAAGADLVREARLQGREDARETEYARGWAAAMGVYRSAAEAKERGA